MGARFGPARYQLDGCPGSRFPFELLSILLTVGSSMHERGAFFDVGQELSFVVARSPDNRGLRSDIYELS